MLLQYVPILLLATLVAAFGVASLVFSDLVGPKRQTHAKGGAYECGMTPIGTARVRLSIHFYLVAVLFILFDVESIFLILWAVGAKQFAAQGVGGVAFAEIAIFVGLLVLALAYVWKKGGLDWDR
jgi:NADH-quinone oxidoreductase subunit A